MNTHIKTAVLAVSLPASLFFSSCNNHKADDHSKDIHTNQTIGDVYACPMHPDMKGKKGDKCPKCGMEMVKQSNDKGNYEMKFIAEPELIEALKPTRLVFTPKNLDDTNEVVRLELMHEKPIHLIAVSEDLSWFHHIHPEQRADDAYAVVETFPNAGKYFLYADYKPAGKPGLVNKIEINVKGVQTAAPPAEESKWVSVTDGYVAILMNAKDLKTGDTHLGFSISKDGKPLSSAVLENYLGAIAHVVMISKADKSYIHIHPGTNDKFLIDGETAVSKPGVYRIWVQFQIKGQVHTADFTVNITQGEKMTGNMKNMDDHAHMH
ncbi:MAG: hypothetical protein IPP93_05630 [Chitinophagaceae bacterium]|nr:hypothetical protein [Chitinophagaceae bacterium]